MKGSKNLQYRPNNLVVVPKNKRILEQRRHIPLETRLRLYDEVHRLRKRGSSYRKIASEIYQMCGIKLSKSSVGYWLTGKHRPHNSVKILPEDIKPSPALAYVIGVILGDGFTIKRGKYLYVIGLKCRDIETIDEFRYAIAKIKKSRPCKPYLERRDKAWRVDIVSRTLYDLLKKPIDLERVKPYVEHDKRCSRNFLKGLFDSEGSMDKKHGYITLYNTDLDLLKYVKGLLLKLKIQVTGPHRKSMKGKTLYNKKNGKIYTCDKDVFYLYIKANSTQRYAKLIGFTIRRKLERLKRRMQA